VAAASLKDAGAASFATTIPRRVGATTSTLSTRTPLGGRLRGRAEHDRIDVADPLLERAVGVDDDLEAAAQQLDPASAID